MCTLFRLVLFAFAAAPAHLAAHVARNAKGGGRERERERDARVSRTLGTRDKSKVDGIYVLPGPTRPSPDPRAPKGEEIAKPVASRSPSRRSY